ncbi:hypothetical protein PCYB_006230 [Plasmodium cynomolgi strain B]|uniref:Uncharacterized protein n=1 Tax=Plasmodium cynomolgi (strain B) TaxID=1120755 RepID=K6V0L3_PLACD|nr:hypothetical protein PCYB_006230 [Plasmodium cynomolgi strain B]GAB69874.1 hypothetical protein PCYB_006230 [Plasmodium cynomolgi strain B]
MGSGNYAKVCKQIVSNYDNLEDSHKEFCKKLVRNLGCYNFGNKYNDPSHEHCHILYNWIYNKKEEYKNLDEIITKCFNNCIDLKDRIKDKLKCSYDLYNNFYKDPMKMTILDIFNNNMESIIRKLIDEYDNDDSPARNFVCEYANIYNEMYENYCNNEKKSDTYHQDTCNMLNSFRYSYMQFFYNNNNIVKKYKIPSLFNLENEYSYKCTSSPKTLERVTLSQGNKETSSPSNNDHSRNTDAFTPSMRVPNNITPSYSISTESFVQNEERSLQSSEFIQEIPAIVTMADENHRTYSSGSISTTEALGTETDEDHSADSSVPSSTTAAAGTEANESHSTGSSGRSSTTTALSTVAAVSSALALLYKV